MNRTHIFRALTNDPASTSNGLLLLGILSILMGLAILIFPQILVAIISAIFMASGFLLTKTAWLMRSLKQREFVYGSRWYDLY